MLLRKAFKLACNGSNLSKGRAGNSILFESCFLLSTQKRGTSKKEKLHSNLASSIYAFSIWSYLEFKKKGGFKKWGPHCRFYQFRRISSGRRSSWREYNLQVLSMVLFEGRYQDSSVPTAHHSKILCHAQVYKAA